MPSSSSTATSSPLDASSAGATTTGSSSSGKKSFLPFTSSTPPSHGSSSAPSFRVLCHSTNSWEKDDQAKICRVCQVVHFSGTSWFSSSSSTGTSGGKQKRHDRSSNEVKMTGGRHHCRRCGQVVCQICSHFNLPYAAPGSRESNVKVHSYHRTCLHCVIWFEAQNLSASKLQDITKQVKERLKDLNLLLEGDMVNIQNYEETIRLILGVTQEDEKQLVIPLFLPHYHEQRRQYHSTNHDLPDSNTHLLSNPKYYLLPLEDFIAKYFLYPYITKIYAIYLHHIHRDLIQYHCHRNVSYDAMLRGHIYPHSQATLRLIILASTSLQQQNQVLNNYSHVSSWYYHDEDGNLVWEENVLQCIQDGADVRHRINLRNTNYSVLSLLTPSRPGIDWRWVNFYNVRDYHEQSSVVNSINVDSFLHDNHHENNTQLHTSRPPLLITPDRYPQKPTTPNSSGGISPPLSSKSSNQDVSSLNSTNGSAKKNGKKTFSWSSILVGKSASSHDLKSSSINFDHQKSQSLMHNDSATNTTRKSGSQLSLVSSTSDLDAGSDIDDEESNDDRTSFLSTSGKVYVIEDLDRELENCDDSSSTDCDGIFATVEDSEEYSQLNQSILSQEPEYTMEEFEQNYYVWKPRPSVSSSIMLDKISFMSPQRVERIKNDVGTNILHVAVASGNTKVVNMLLGGRKDLNIKSTKYKRSVQYLRYKLHYENEEGLSAISVAQMLYQTPQENHLHNTADDMLAILVQRAK